MNLEELRSLDPRDPGRWPLAVRAGVIAIAFVVLSLVGLYMLVWNGQRETLQQYETEEITLRDQYREKHSKAVNLDLYKQQLADIERSFGAMLRQLPGKTEMPNLLVDISQTGLAAGLKQQLFQRMPEQTQDFYAEQPIKIRLTGSFHQMGEFVSGIAALPRIVTLHDVEVKALPQAAYDQLQLDVTARTYRYLDEEELAAAEVERRKAQQGQRGSSGG
jgi:type IV pilus assembly protein PilO